MVIDFLVRLFVELIVDLNKNLVSDDSLDKVVSCQFLDSLLSIDYIYLD